MISLLVVNFRSSALAAEAVRSARASSTSPIQVVIVDNSCDPAEAQALQEFADELIVSSTNRGYAGAINDGRRACRGDVIVISNPDVVFAPHAIDLLAGALDARTVVSGPALFWDEAHRWHLPPGDLLTAREKLDQILASRSARWRVWRDRRRFAARVAFWSLRTSTRVNMLSGAVMAVQASAFDLLEGFDERFPLYFEETDFLRRVGAHHKRIAYVPEARCRHIYNQSAAQTGEVAAARYAESEWKYLEKWNGPWLARVMKRWERPSPVAGDADRDGTDAPRGSNLEGTQEVVTEASPLASFETAAGYFGRADGVPPEIRQSLGSSPLYLRYRIRA
jgi:N-acetylglucosaminyl-diphospho-decaprenol L-rhamnosyltransferase